jgi:hypothetical protein
VTDRVKPHDHDGNDVSGESRFIKIFKRQIIDLAALDHGGLAGLADDDHPQYLLHSEVADDTEPNSRTFTNAGYLDLDALTGGAGTITAVAVSVATGTRALVMFSAEASQDTGGGFVQLSYRVSGATTVASSDVWSSFFQAPAANTGASLNRTRVHTGLTAGTNVFELQAKNPGAGISGISRLDLVVIPL